MKEVFVICFTLGLGLGMISGIFAMKSDMERSPAYYNDYWKDKKGCEKMLPRNLECEVEYNWKHKEIKL